MVGFAPQYTDVKSGWQTSAEPATRLARCGILQHHATDHHSYCIAMRVFAGLRTSEAGTTAT
jgi:hypothetical protein